MSDNELRQLKALDLPITMGLLVKLEGILGVDRINTLKTTGQCEVSIHDRVMILKLIGYTDAEAQECSIEICEAEMTCFFSNWLEGSLKGKLGSLLSQPSPTPSTAPKPSARTSRKPAKPAKTSSRKGSRSRQ